MKNKSGQGTRPFTNEPSEGEAAGQPGVTGVSGKACDEVIEIESDTEQPIAEPESAEMSRMRTELGEMKQVVESFVLTQSRLRSDIMNQVARNSDRADLNREGEERQTGKSRDHSRSPSPTRNRPLPPHRERKRNRSRSPKREHKRSRKPNRSRRTDRRRKSRSRSPCGNKAEPEALVSDQCEETRREALKFFETNKDFSLPCIENPKDGIVYLHIILKNHQSFVEFARDEGPRCRNRPSSIELMSLCRALDAIFATAKRVDRVLEEAQSDAAQILARRAVAIAVGNRTGKSVYFDAIEGLPVDPRYDSNPTPKGRRLTEYVAEVLGKSPASG